MRRQAPERLFVTILPPQPPKAAQGIPKHGEGQRRPRPPVSILQVLLVPLLQVVVGRGQLQLCGAFNRDAQDRRERPACGPARQPHFYGPKPVLGPLYGISMGALVRCRIPSGLRARWNTTVRYCSLEQLEVELVEPNARLVV
jgi:hypothetical protein